jgi:hypothetical protein
MTTLHDFGVSDVRQLPLFCEILFLPKYYESVFTLFGLISGDDIADSSSGYNYFGFQSCGN